MVMMRVVIVVVAVVVEYRNYYPMREKNRLQVKFILKKELFFVVLTDVI